MDPEKQQKLFEEHLEILINYKKFHPQRDVYLNEKSLNEAFEWYKKGLSSVANMEDSE